jgi:hypothetical protein
MKRQKVFVAAVLVALAALVGWSFIGGHRTPAGQPALATLDSDSFSSFKAEFNDSTDRIRLVVLLSPT